MRSTFCNAGLFAASFICLFACFSCANRQSEGAAGENTGAPEGSKWLLYVGTYTVPMSHVNGKAEGLYQMTIDRESGQLAMVGVTKDVTNPSFAAVSPDHKYIYAVNEVGSDVAPEGWITAFRIDPAVPRPILIGQAPSHGLAPCHLTVDRTGKYVLVANYGGGIAVMPIDKDGTLGIATTTMKFDGKGPNPDQDASHPHMICISPDNNFVYVPDKGTDRINTLRLDTIDGTLRWAGKKFVPTKPGAGPRHMTFHPSGRFAYVINELDNTVNAYSWEPLNGNLAELQSISALPEGFTGKSYCADIHISPDGKFLYGSNRGHNSIVIYSVDQDKGTLTLVGHEATRGDFPRNFLISPDGRFLYVANQNTDNIVIFRRSDSDGKLAFAGQYKVPTPVCLQVW